MAAYGHRFNYLVLYEIAVAPHPSIRHFGLNVRNDKHTLSQWYLVGKKIPLAHTITSKNADFKPVASYLINL